MSPREDAQGRKAPDATARLKAKRIQERPKTQRAQGPLANEHDSTFRETFLCRFRDRETADALRLFGSLALTIADRAGYPPVGEDTAIASALAGAAADLQHLSGYLQEVGDRVEGSEEDTRQARLKERSKEWARTTADLAKEIQGEIDLGR